MKSCAAALDFFENIGGFGGPDERFWAVVVAIDVVVDGGDEFVDAAENAAANALDGEVAKEAFDHVEPRRTRRGEMDVESFVAGEPASDLRVFVGRVVVHDEVEFLLGRGLAVNLPQELQPFLMAVFFHAGADQLAV